MVVKGSRSRPVGPPTTPSSTAPAPRHSTTPSSTRFDPGVTTVTCDRDGRLCTATCGVGSVDTCIPTSRRPDTIGVDVRLVFAAFLFGHAAVHAVMWTLPFTDATTDMPFDPSRSWLLGTSRTLAVVVAGLATVGFVVAPVGYLVGAGWWPAVMFLAAVVSLLLMILYFTPWWSVGIVLSAGVAVYAWQHLPA